MSSMGYDEQMRIQAELDAVFTGEDAYDEAIAKNQELADAQEQEAAASDEVGDANTNTFGKFLSGARVVGGLSSSMRLLMMNSLKLEMAQQTLAQRQDTVANAQMNYNSAVEKYGAGSDQAIKAHNNLERAILAEQKAQERLNMTQNMQYLMLLPMGVRMLALAGRAYKMFQSDTEEADVGQKAMNVDLEEGVMWENMLTFGLAALAGAAATYAAMSYIQSTQSSTTGTRSMQYGGVAPTTGLYNLHAGETVVSPYPVGYPALGAGAGGSSGGDTNVYVYLQGDAQDFLRVQSVEYEYESQRRGQVSYGS